MGAGSPKPFRFQGSDVLPFYGRRATGPASRLLDMARQEALLQDTVLFTASDREGEVVLTAMLEGKSASIRIQVDSEAPSRTKTQEIRFRARTTVACPVPSAGRTLRSLHCTRDLVSAEVGLYCAV